MFGSHQSKWYLYLQYINTTFTLNYYYELSCKYQKKL